MRIAGTIGRVTVLAVAVVVLCPLVPQATERDLKARLAVANSTAECREFAQRFNKFGTVRTSSFDEHQPPVFVVWISPNPNDEKPAFFVFGYFLRKEKWYLFLDQTAPGRADSIRLSDDGNRLIVTSHEGGELISASIANPVPLSERGSR